MQRTGFFKYSRSFIITQRQQKHKKIKGVLKK